MIDFITQFFTRKQIILYDKHRQTAPLASNLKNKNKFWFFDINLIWQVIPFKTSDKRKHKVMYFLLSCIQPKYIITINWQTKRESLYKVWTAKNNKSKFMVVQHGAYVGGIVTDLPHKYTKCDVFLTWGLFFTEKFRKNNLLKKVEIINFGNTVFNEFKREKFAYKENITNKILILPTALNIEGVLHITILIKKLEELNFEVYVKEHAKQGIEKNKSGTIIYPIIENVTKIKGQLYPLLQRNDFDFIICDHSSSLLDAIFFKNKVLYFDPLNNKKGYKTNYSNYLPNLYQEDFNNLNKKKFYQLINLEKQDSLFHAMVTLGNNQII